MERAKSREPDFRNLLDVLAGKKPSRATLFEYFMNEDVYLRLNDGEPQRGPDESSRLAYLASAFRKAGYDYVCMRPFNFDFPRKRIHKEKSISLNDGTLIANRRDFERYSWPDPEKCDYSILEDARTILPEGMKWIAWAPWGIVENANSLVGYDNVCLMSYDDPDLLAEIFNALGTRLLKHYRICLASEAVGAVIYNDDWGFNTQPMFSPDFFERYVFPWVRNICAAAHAVDKPIILHSCGKLESLMDTIITDLKFNGKHSFQDIIMPVEEAYRKYSSEIAILGGIDVDFMCRASIKEIKARAFRLLEMSESKGAYALGTGNSVPAYLPIDNYFTMIEAVNEYSSISG